ncbi:hypothetical protein [Nocardia sp. CA-120079]|uniref:hypothetical protein n=1 Tax=Nocardia sp. CA-120079 TaxID=3239974 RepID=UPI003D994E50
MPIVDAGRQPSQNTADHVVAGMRPADQVRLQQDRKSDVAHEAAIEIDNDGRVTASMEGSELLIAAWNLQIAP